MTSLYIPIWEYVKRPMLPSLCDSSNFTYPSAGWLRQRELELVFSSAFPHMSHVRELGCWTYVPDFSSNPRTPTGAGRR